MGIDSYEPNKQTRNLPIRIACQQEQRNTDFNVVNHKMLLSGVRTLAPFMNMMLWLHAGTVFKSWT